MRRRVVAFPSRGACVRRAPSHTRRSRTTRRDERRGWEADVEADRAARRARTRGDRDGGGEPRLRTAELETGQRGRKRRARHAARRPAALRRADLVRFPGAALPVAVESSFRVKGALAVEANCARGRVAVAFRRSATQAFRFRAPSVRWAKLRLEGRSMAMTSCAPATAIGFAPSIAGIDPGGYSSAGELEPPPHAPAPPLAAAGEAKTPQSRYATQAGPPQRLREHVRINAGDLLVGDQQLLGR